MDAVSDAYTLDDLRAMKALNFRRHRYQTIPESLSVLKPVSSLNYLLNKGFDRDVAVRAALPSDAYVCNSTVSLLDCGYTEDEIRAYLTDINEKERQREAARALQEALERTLRYRLRRNRIELRRRVKQALGVLRGTHECEWNND